MRLSRVRLIKNYFQASSKTSLLLVLLVYRACSRLLQLMRYLFKLMFWLDHIPAGDIAAAVPVGAFQSQFQDLCAQAELTYTPTVVVCTRSRYGVQIGTATGADERKPTKQAKKDDKTLAKSTDDKRAGWAIRVSLIKRCRLLHGRIALRVRSSVPIFSLKSQKSGERPHNMSALSRHIFLHGLCARL